MIVRYHIITSGPDILYDEGRLEEAVVQMQKYLDDGEEDVRLYKEIYKSPEEAENQWFQEAICLLAIGG